MTGPMGKPSYFDDVMTLAAAHAKPGTVSELFVLHDDACALVAGNGGCNCSPTVTAGVVLWARAGKRAKWKPRGTYPTMQLAAAAVRGRGDFLLLPAGKSP